jgi:hypothetical protein
MAVGMGGVDRRRLPLVVASLRRRACSSARTPIEERTHRTTGINLPAEMWEMLNRAAFERARKYGGRASVSKLLVELVERHRKELEKELGG